MEWIGQAVMRPHLVTARRFGHNGGGRMKVRSIAPHLPDGEVVIVRDRETLAEYEVTKGKPADLPDVLALSLLEQTDSWAPSGAEAKEAAERVAS